MFTYAIADLHGRFDLLAAAFQAIAADAMKRRADFKIITLGDYVDRGPESRQIIEHLMAAQRAGMNLICLKGNHEDMMAETLGRPLELDWWAGNGGSTTLRSYGDEVPSTHLHWMSNLPKMHVDRHRVFVHAGIDETRELDEQLDEHLLWFRYPDGADIGYRERHLVHGHTPRPHGPEKLSNRTNLDTYAWKTGRLVVACFDDSVPGSAVDYIEVAR